MKEFSGGMRKLKSSEVTEFSMRRGMEKSGGCRMSLRRGMTWSDMSRREFSSRRRNHSACRTTSNAEAPLGKEGEETEGKF